ncbi:hypothetical protein CBR_g757 [Chara braunii]|uniref:DBP10 C-terminal domain-containing protein n=1 Tax=Chara braunii TaxID=69332 RepID=A0A388KC43_CHABU|nr:hypothetical protein CBR_g757 [Chara braunii]|eukprot:GBG67628.1 hypothetical protein CBR_g757 [Chara braunii]
MNCALFEKQGGIAEAADVMKRKREVHERVIAASHEKAKERERARLQNSRESDESEDESEDDDDEKKRSKARKSFRDEENYIGLSHQNQFVERELTISGKTGGESFGNPSMDAAVLDILPDEASGVAKKRATYHWDKRKKKYTRLLPGEKMTAAGKIKTESGVKVNKSQTGLYRKWQQRTKMKIPAVGTENEDERPSSAGGRMVGQGSRSGEEGRGFGRGRIGGGGGGSLKRKREDSGTHWKPKEELRNPDQVRKEKQKKIIKQRLVGKGRGRHDGGSWGREEGSGGGRHGGGGRGRGGGRHDGGGRGRGGGRHGGGGRGRGGGRHDGGSRGRGGGGGRGGGFKGKVGGGRGGGGMPKSGKPMKSFGRGGKFGSKGGKRK